MRLVGAFGAEHRAADRRVARLAKTVWNGSLYFVGFVGVPVAVVLVLAAALAVIVASVLLFRVGSSPSGD
jgi:hypothetical protein